TPPRGTPSPRADPSARTGIHEVDQRLVVAPRHQPAACAAGAFPAAIGLPKCVIATPMRDAAPRVHLRCDFASALQVTGNVTVPSSSAWV
ncbi:MAG: hypothetical protein ABL963_17555, partial [Longimicrobiales bacterium]